MSFQHVCYKAYTCTYIFSGTVGPTWCLLYIFLYKKAYIFQQGIVKTNVMSVSVSFV